VRKAFKSAAFTALVRGKMLCALKSVAAVLFAVLVKAAALRV
jgi:hypothetical protein